MSEYFCLIPLRSRPSIHPIVPTKIVSCAWNVSKAACREIRGAGRTPIGALDITAAR